MRDDEYARELALLVQERDRLWLKILNHLVCRDLLLRKEALRSQHWHTVHWRSKRRW